MSNKSRLQDNNIDLTKLLSDVQALPGENVKTQLDEQETLISSIETALAGKCAYSANGTFSWRKCQNDTDHTFIGYEVSNVSTTYPDGAVHTDGYWYEKVGDLKIDNGITVTSAVSTATDMVKKYQFVKHVDESCTSTKVSTDSTSVFQRGSGYIVRDYILGWNSYNPSGTSYYYPIVYKINSDGTVLKNASATVGFWGYLDSSSANMSDITTDGKLVYGSTYSAYNFFGASVDLDTGSIGSCTQTSLMKPTSSYATSSSRYLMLKNNYVLEVWSGETYAYTYYVVGSLNPTTNSVSWSSTSTSMGTSGGYSSGIYRLNDDYFVIQRSSSGSNSTTIWLDNGYGSISQVSASLPSYCSISSVAQISDNKFLMYIGDSYDYSSYKITSYGFYVLTLSGTTGTVVKTSASSSMSMIQCKIGLSEIAFVVQSGNRYTVTINEDDTVSLEEMSSKYALMLSKFSPMVITDIGDNSMIGHVASTSYLYETINYYSAGIVPCTSSSDTIYGITLDKKNYDEDCRVIIYGEEE